MLAISERPFYLGNKVYFSTTCRGISFAKQNKTAQTASITEHIHELWLPTNLIRKSDQLQKIFLIPLIECYAPLSLYCSISFRMAVIITKWVPYLRTRGVEPAGLLLLRPGGSETFNGSLILEANILYLITDTLSCL